MDSKTSVSMQGIGDVSRQFNQMRADALLKNISIQDTNLENALNALQEVRDFYSAPDKILGSPATKHGEIAEHMQVGFENADRLIVGETPTHTFEGVGRTAPEDYLKNGLPVQSKFVQRNLSVDAIADHLNKYPDYLTKGGTYDIPRDYYEQIREWLDLPPSELNNLPASEGGETARRVVEKIRRFEQENNVKFEDVVNPSQVKYGEAQINAAGKTVDAKEQQIKEADKAERRKYELQAKASLKEGLAAAGISAAIDGVLSFGMTVAGKLSQGKKLDEFDDEDWSEIFKNAGVGVVRGGAAGGGIYALTNAAGMSAPLAASLVTATIGLVNQTVNLAKGKISFDDFMGNMVDLSAEAAVSGVGAFLGQMVIPVPVVGAMIGSLVSAAVLHNIKDNVFGGGYYTLLDKAEHEYAISSVHTALTNALEISRVRFEDSVREFTYHINASRELMRQSAENQSNIKTLIENI